MIVLEPDKSHICKISPLTKVYVRTGVHGDGSCFLHAFLKATQSKLHSLQSYDSQLQKVNNLRAQLADSVNQETLKALGRGEHRKMLFFTHLNLLLERGFEQDEIGQFLARKISLPKILQTCTTFKENFYLEFINYISAHHPKEFEKYKSYITNFCYNTFMVAHQQMINSFKNSLLQNHIGSIEIEYISRYFKTNFLFMKETDGFIQPYPLVSEIINPNWPFIVLLWINDSHYEVIGRRLDNKTIVRQFAYSDEIVQHVVERKD